MPAPRHSLGIRAEAAVGAALEQRGWHLLARRWRVPGGELDLVCLDPRGTLVAIEVRARSSARTGMAIESLDGRRLARLRGTLVAYAEASGVAHSGLRVDLVTVDRTESGWRAVRRQGIDEW